MTSMDRGVAQFVSPFSQIVLFPRDFTFVACTKNAVICFPIRASCWETADADHIFRAISLDRTIKVFPFA